MKLCPIFYSFHLLWRKVGTDYVHKHLLSDYEFCEIWRSECHTFTWERKLICIQHLHIYYPI
jgi:hypothetical protein